MLLLLGVFFLGRISAEKSPEPKNNLPPSNSQEIQQLKSELNSVKSQLSQSNINQKSQLENKLAEIGNKISESVKQNNPLSQSDIKQLEENLKKIKQKLKENKPDNQENDEPKPNQDKPDKNGNPKNNPPKGKSNQNSNSDDLVSTIFKWSGSDVSGYWVFMSRKERAIQVHIAKDHPFLKGKKLDNSKDTPLFGILFEKKNASKQEGNDTWYFDKDNDNFELEPFGDWLDEPETSNKEEVKVEYAGINIMTHDTHIFLLEENKDYLFSISKNHPRIKQLLSQNKLQKDKKFTIRYEKIDKKSDSGLIFTFNEDNKELEIVEA